MAEKKTDIGQELELDQEDEEEYADDMLHDKTEIVRQQRDMILSLKRELEGVISERDLLLCEVSNLRFELEMIELKRLQDDSFPVKMDRPQVVTPVVSSYSQEQTYIQAQNYMHNQTANSSYQGPMYSTPQGASGGSYSRTAPNSSAACTAYVNVSQGQIVNAGYSHQQNLHKKGSLRNGDVLKRSRVQTMYELSQDLLDKQIEVLERKYGGVKARTAALTIQRAFRRYTLLKKFAAITAMAKAEKRTSRRITNGSETESVQSSPRNLVEPEQYMSPAYIKQMDGEQACLSSSPSCRPMPVRSLSLRERRNVSNASLPRSQSGTGNMCWESCGSSAGAGAGAGARVPSHQLVQAAHGLESSGGGNGSLKQVQSCSMLWARTASADAASSSSSGSVNGYSHPRTSPLQPPPHSHSSSPHSHSQHHLSHSHSHSHTSSSSIYSQLNSKKVPPEVPKRTSSISSRSVEPRPQRSNGLTKSTENGSLSSVQSSGSDSSVSTDRVVCDATESCRFSVSPVWKRQGHGHGHGHTSEYSEAISETSLGSISHTSGSAYTLEHTDQPNTTTSSYKISETVRKRQYRVGLNLFNKKPDRGISYLIRRGFLENSPQGVARFLISRKGLSKQMIGEYLGNLQSPFSMTVLECFAHELDLSGMQVDVALRKYQAYFRMPGEAQKIERLMEVFSQRYCQCNLDIVARLRSPDTVFVLAFAIIMLNTDLHTPNLKAERRMRLVDFIKNLRGIDDCGDIDSDMLAGIYERVKGNEFKPGSDHVTQVMKVQATIVGKKPNLALPHRRLVCYCRLYEIPDINKKERPGVHQREVFLFNDLLVITKILGKKKSSVTYTFRKSFPLCGMVVTLFESPYYLYGIRLSQRVDGKLLIVFNARNEHDRFKFAEDLRESICEMDEMENLRIEAELDRQKSSRGNRTGTENRDSGVADVEVCPCTQNMALRSPEQSSIDDSVHEMQQFKRSALSNSLLDIHEQFTGEKAGPQRRGSVGSLDSGMSVSFHSSSTSTEKYNLPSKSKVAVSHQHSFLGGLFNKRERSSSSSGGSGAGAGTAASTGASIGPAQRHDDSGHYVKSTGV